MGKKLTVGFDLDGVLYPWHMYVWEDLFNKGAIEFTFEYFWSKAWKEYPSSWWKSVVEDPLPYMREYSHGALDVVNRINKKHDIYYLTKRPENVKMITYNSLYGNGFPRTDKLYFIGNHEDISKREVVVKQNTDYYVEDRIEYIKDLLEVTKVVAFTQPHNVEFLDENPDILRINSILELPKILGL